jgi:hypothetical protein
VIANTRARRNVIEGDGSPARVTRIGDARSKLPADPHRALGLPAAERRRPGIGQLAVELPL